MRFTSLCRCIAAFVIFLAPQLSANNAEGHDGNADATVQLEFNALTRNLTCTGCESPKGLVGSVRYRAPVVLKVVGFNPFLYELRVQGKAQSFNEEAPQAFQEIAPPAQTSGESTAGFKAAPGESLKRFGDAAEDFNGALASAYTDLQAFAVAVRNTILSSDGLGKRAIEKKVNSAVTGALGPECIGLEECATAATSLAKKVRTKWLAVELAYGALGGAQSQYKPVHDALKNAWDVYASRDEAILLDGARQAVATWRQLKLATFKATAGPFLAEGDELCLSVAINRKAGLEAQYQINHTLDETNVACLQTYGGIKVDFSAGVFFTKLVDRVYGTRTTETPEGTEVRAIERLSGEEDSFALATGALVHVYPRQKWLGRNLQLAASFGLATAGESDLVYALGISALLGRQRRGALTMGVAGGKTATLGGGYRVGDALADGVGTVPTREAFSSKFFVSFSFNFGGGGE